MDVDKGRMNLQLFGGGGGKSGLGGGGGDGGSGERGYHEYMIKYIDRQGKEQILTIDAKSQEEAEKWAEDYRKKNKDVKEMKTPEQVKKKKSKKKS